MAYIGVLFFWVSIAARSQAFHSARSISATALMPLALLLRQG